MLNGLDLFSGDGMLTKALEPFVRPVAYCEKDKFAWSVLLSRQEWEEIPIAPIWDDIRTLHGFHVSPVDIIYGGFPCQDISLAGRRAGLAGKRSGLFWEIIRLTEECSPVFILLENVWPGVSPHVKTITDAFEKLGFQCRDGVLGAVDVGANHKRERWFLFATHPERLKLRIKSGRSGGEKRENQILYRVSGKESDLADTKSIGLDSLRAKSKRRTPGGSRSGDAREMANADRTGLAIGESVDENAFTKFSAAFREDWWKLEPPVGRVANGDSDKLARALRVCELHSLGNGVVPRQAREAVKKLIGFDF